MISRIIPEPRSLHDLVGQNALLLYTEVADLAGMHKRTFQKRLMDTGILSYVRPSPRKLLIPTNQFTVELADEITEFADALRDYRLGQVVYFIRAGDEGPIKIGIACDMERRFAELQNVHFAELRLLVTRDGGLKIERDYHRKFAGHRIRGEWFAPHPDILAEIDRLNFPHLQEPTR